MKNTRNAILRTLLAGFLALLPLVLTATLVGWVAGIIYRYIGPGSVLGRLFAAIGLAFVANPITAYLLGTLLLLVCIYFIGILVQSRLKGWFTALLDRTLRPLPLIGSVYDVTDRFIGMFSREKDTDHSAMSPVWCFFGGDGGTAVLALLPNPHPLIIGDEPYHVILVPTAPVPVGGGLLFVPARWVKPAGFGIEGLTSLYVSMGITMPKTLTAGLASPPAPPAPPGDGDPQPRAESLT
ncbi:MAG: DUF502 domain-containing protein [Tepidisphaeraceae bacterium]